MKRKKQEKNVNIVLKMHYFLINMNNYNRKKVFFAMSCEL